MASDPSTTDNARPDRVEQLGLGDDLARVKEQVRRTSSGLASMSTGDAADPQLAPAFIELAVGESPDVAGSAFAPDQEARWNPRSLAFFRVS